MKNAYLAAREEGKGDRAAALPLQRRAPAPFHCEIENDALRKNDYEITSNE